MNHRLTTIGAALSLIAAAASAQGAELIRPVSQRFASPEATEVPDFQRHMLPLMGRLGCNTRSCHGSFQGQGGFRLSLFGYDFKMDHEALHKSGSERVVVDNPEASKILQKPTLTIPHKGGKRMEEESWQYRMFVRWIEDGAKGVTNPVHFDRLEVTPTEIVFQRDGERQPLRVVAYWQDGTQEDVTCITRFRTNDESIAEVDADGVVTSKGKGDTHIVAFYDNGVAVTQVLHPVSHQVGPKYPDVKTNTKIDQLVVEKLRKLGIVPSSLSTDAEFLRRVSVDMTGTLPTPDEVSAFLADSSPTKRQKKIDELLTRPTYAAWWTNKFCDLTGNAARNLQLQVPSTQPSVNWYDWIYRRVKENVPYDELIAGIVLAVSRKPGQTYDDFVKEEASYYRAKDPADYSARETMPYFWARRNLRTPEEKALGFSYTFLGVRLECAQCHKHPFDQWTQDDFNQFTAFFRPVGYGVGADKESREAARKLRDELGLAKKTGNEQRQILSARIKEGQPVPWQEVFVTTNGQQARIRGKQGKGVTPGRVITPKVLGGDEVSLANVRDPRAPLMEWMRSKDNPYFARAFINRVWANYFGSGIVNPPDDMNLANPPSNPALLDYLADGFIAHNFDMTWLHREITNSDTYQRSWQTNATNRLDERNFSHAIVRRLPAEVLVDAVAQATAASDEVVRLARSIDERVIGHKGIPGVNRRGNNDYATRVFGRSSRDTNCDCSRSNEPNLLQSIYLQNDQEVLAAIERPGGWLAESVGKAVKGRNANPTSATRPENAEQIERRIGEVEKRVRKLRADGETKRAEVLEARLESFRSQLRGWKKENARDEKSAPASSFEVDRAIDEAYLRTLGRRPDGDEKGLARDYFAKSSNAEKGLRDLLWALLNTKEFITNH